MVVNGSCQTPGWDSTYARVCQCKSPTWGETGHCLLISDALEGCPQCWGWSCVWRCLYHIMAMWISGPVGIPLIECFLLGLLEFTCQDNIFINTQYLIFGGNRGLSILRSAIFIRHFLVWKKKCSFKKIHNPLFETLGASCFSEFVIFLILEKEYGAYTISIISQGGPGHPHNQTN